MREKKLILFKTSLFTMNNPLELELILQQSMLLMIFKLFLQNGKKPETLNKDFISINHQMLKKIMKWWSSMWLEPTKMEKPNFKSKFWLPILMLNRLLIKLTNRKSILTARFLSILMNFCVSQKNVTLKILNQKKPLRSNAKKITLLVKKFCMTLSITLRVKMRLLGLLSALKANSLKLIWIMRLYVSMLDLSQTISLQWKIL